MEELTVMIGRMNLDVVSEDMFWICLLGVCIFCNSQRKYCNLMPQLFANCNDIKIYPTKLSQIMYLNFLIKLSEIELIEVLFLELVLFYPFFTSFWIWMSFFKIHLKMCNPHLNCFSQRAEAISSSATATAWAWSFCATGTLSVQTGLTNETVTCQGRPSAASTSSLATAGASATGTAATVSGTAPTGRTKPGVTVSVELTWSQQWPCFWWFWLSYDWPFIIICLTIYSIHSSCN